MATKKAPAKSPPSEKPRVAPDWERIEHDYRAGLLSLREIAGQHGLTHGAINKRAKRDGWVRSLASKIQARAEQLVSTQAVSTPVSAETRATERQIIEANAERIAQVRSEHRQDIGRGRKLVIDLLAELETQTAGIEVFERLGELMDKSGEDENGRPIVDKLNEAYHKVIGFSGRVGNIKALSEALKNLVALERQAYGLDAATPKEGEGDITITF